MANERTVLAWVRTGAVFLTLAITFIQFSHLASTANSVTVDGVEYEMNVIDKVRLDQYGRVIEILCITLGICCLVFGMVRYFHTQALLTKDHFPVARVPVVILIAINVVLVVLLVLLDTKLFKS